MFALRDMTIKGKLRTINMLTVVAALLLAGSIFIAWRWVQARRHELQDLSTHAEIIAENCKAAVAFEDAKDAEEVLKALRVNSPVIFGGVYIRSRDEAFASYYRDGADTKVEACEFKTEGHIFGGGHLTVFRRIVLDGETIGVVCLQSDLRPMYAMLKRDTTIITGALFFACLMAYVLSSRLQRVISEPILSLANIARAVSDKKNYSMRAVKCSEDELGVLVDAFNQMLEQVQEHQSALVSVNERLEARVRERTAKLTSTNERLTREITERKRAQEKLKRAADKWQITFDSITDLVSVQDANFKLIQVNKAYADAFNMRPEELVGKRCYELVHCTEEPVAGCPHKAVVETGKPVRTELFDCHLGKYIEVFEAPIINEKGEVGGNYVHIIKDITKRKKAEQALESLNKNLAEIVEKLKQSNQQLQDFVYIASHDLREPLRKISSFGRLIQQSLEGKLNDDDTENLQFMIDGADRMQQMIDALLVYSRVSTTGSAFERTDLNRIVEELKSLELAAQIEETNGAIEVAEPLPTVNGDTAQIRQVLQNLISNGLKYHRPDVAPRIVVRAVRQNENMVRIEVEDNGIGIQEQYYKDIFTMFRRLHLREEYSGSGIGLAICKKIIERHGGEIGIESNVGQGSVFWFTLAPVEEVKKQDARSLVSQES